MGSSRTYTVLDHVGPFGATVYMYATMYCYRSDLCYLLPHCVVYFTSKCPKELPKIP